MLILIMKGAAPMKYFWYFCLVMIILATGLWMYIVAFYLFYLMCKGIYKIFSFLKPAQPYERPRPHISDAKPKATNKNFSTIKDDEYQTEGLSVDADISEAVKGYHQGEESKETVITVKGAEEKMSLNMASQKEDEDGSINSLNAPDDENLTSYLARFSASEIAASPKCGMRIIAELTDGLMPAEWHAPWDLVGKDIFEVMSYLVEPDSVDYGDYCEMHYYLIYGGHYLALLVDNDVVIGVCWG